MAAGSGYHHRCRRPREHRRFRRANQQRQSDSRVPRTGARLRHDRIPQERSSRPAMPTATFRWRETNHRTGQRGFGGGAADATLHRRPSVLHGVVPALQSPPDAIPVARRDRAGVTGLSGRGSRSSPRAADPVAPPPPLRSRRVHTLDVSSIGTGCVVGRQPWSGIGTVWIRDTFQSPSSRTNTIDVGAEMLCCWPSIV